MGSFPVSVATPAPEPVLQVNRLTLPGLAASAPVESPTELVAGPLTLTVVSPAVTEDAVLAADDQTEAVRETLVSSARAGAEEAPDDIVTAASSDREERIPIFFEYEVKAGETVSSIADRFGVGTDYITWNNVDILSDADNLTEGDMLQIPSTEGMVHSVRVGETVSDIADLYDAEARDILDFRANGLDDPNDITDGTLILVPGGRKVPVEPPPSAVPGQPLPQPSGGWVWPAQGNVTSPFTAWHPMGIDIAMSGGTPLAASQAGTVTFVGGNPCCSYGYHIIIDHGDGYETLYAHLSGFSVQPGQQVGQGEIIGTSGNTGLSTGPHLHFELRRGGVYQDPLQYFN